MAHSSVCSIDASVEKRRCCCCCCEEEEDEEEDLRFLENIVADVS